MVMWREKKQILVQPGFGPILSTFFMSFNSFGIGLHEKNDYVFLIGKGQRKGEFCGDILYSLKSWYVINIISILFPASLLKSKIK